VKILLVDDDPDLLSVTGFALQQAGFLVVQAGDGLAALDAFQREQPDLAVLDINLPKLNGFDLARKLRERSKIPLIMLTARNEEEDVVRALSIGADDYLTKPFHLRELLLRVQRIIQRAHWYGASPRPRKEVNVAGYTVNLEDLRGRGPHGELQLTALEASLLEVLTAEPNRVLSRTELLERVWGYHSDVESRTVDNFIVRLRRYFEEEPDQPQHFVSVRSRGYMYVP